MLNPTAHPGPATYASATAASLAAVPLPTVALGALCGDEADPRAIRRRQPARGIWSGVDGEARLASRLLPTGLERAVGNGSGDQAERWQRRVVTAGLNRCTPAVCVLLLAPLGGALLGSGVPHYQSAAAQ